LLTSGFGGISQDACKLIRRYIVKKNKKFSELSDKIIKKNNIFTKNRDEFKLEANH
jgi:hypothetical protein